MTWTTVAAAKFWSPILRRPGNGLKGAELRITVNDDDDADVIITTTDRERGVAESDTVTYAVKLKSAPPSGEVSVLVSTTDPAVAYGPRRATDVQYIWDPALPGVGRIRSQSPVTVVDDDVDNPGRSANIIFTPSGGGGYGPGEAKSRTITVADDDTAALELSESELEVGEDGGSDRYDVSLKSQPTGTVTVTVTSSNPAIAKVDTDLATPGEQHTLRFRPDNWETLQPVMVTGVSDATRGDRTATVTHTPAGGGYGSGQSGPDHGESDGRRFAGAEGAGAGGGSRGRQFVPPFSVGVELPTDGRRDSDRVQPEHRNSSRPLQPSSLTFSPTNWDTAQPGHRNRCERYGGHRRSPRDHHARLHRGRRQLRLRERRGGYGNRG